MSLTDVSSTRDQDLIEIGKLAVEAQHYWDRYHRDGVDDAEEQRALREHNRAYHALESATKAFVAKWGAP